MHDAPCSRLAGTLSRRGSPAKASQRMPRLKLVAPQEVAGPDLQGDDGALRGRGVAVHQQLQAEGGGGGRGQAEASAGVEPRLPHKTKDEVSREAGSCARHACMHGCMQLVGVQPWLRNTRTAPARHAPARPRHLSSNTGLRLCRKSTLPRSVTRLMQGPTSIFTLLRGRGRDRAGKASGHVSTEHHSIGTQATVRQKHSRRTWYGFLLRQGAACSCTQGLGPSSQVAGEAGLRPAGQVLGPLQVDAQHAAAQQARHPGLPAQPAGGGDAQPSGLTCGRHSSDAGGQ